jgi:hypothetical protein
VRRLGDRTNWVRANILLVILVWSHRYLQTPGQELIQEAVINKRAGGAYCDHQPSIYSKYSRLPLMVEKITKTVA